MKNTEVIKFDEWEDSIWNEMVEHKVIRISRWVHDFNENIIIFEYIET